jgi:hypothetical protein
MAINRSDPRHWKTFKTQDRALFNAIPINKDGKQVVMQQDHKVPVYLYEVSAPQKKAQGFWMLLKGALSSVDPEDAYKLQFYSWDNGSTLKITFIKDTWEGKEYAKVSGLDFVHPRFDYSKERAKYEPHLYKIHDIYQEPNVDEMVQYLELMQKYRGAGSDYNAAAPSPADGFYAGGGYTAAPGTSAWAAGQAVDDTPF